MTLVDSSVLLDVVTDDPVWADWSVGQLDALSLAGALAINDVVYAEISVRFAAIEVLDAMLVEAGIDLAVMPRAALFLAGKAFLRYRAEGGRRAGVLPDLFIGAHAAVMGADLLTRDPRRVARHFPGVRLVCP